MKTYKFDTHVHTCETSQCGMLSGAEVVRLYKDAGYDGIIITDHYHQQYFDSLGKLEWEKRQRPFLTDIALPGRRENGSGSKFSWGWKYVFLKATMTI